MTAAPARPGGPLSGRFRARAPGPAQTGAAPVDRSASRRPDHPVPLRRADPEEEAP